jgi:predicted small integral membrane protein
LLAKETGFCIRDSKLSPEVFFDLLFFASSHSHNSSLEHLVSHLYSSHVIDIRKQSLDERFTDKTVRFVKAVLSRLIQLQFSDMLICEGFLSDFNHVRIKDSTTFKVPDNLASHYGGNGGGAAGISIQYEFDLKTGQFLDLTITEACRNDQTDSGETAENICENDLVLRDMGYFSTSVLRKFDDKNAFYLSRLPSTISVYDENDVEIDFKKIGVFMSENRIEIMEKQVWIGETRLPVRLMIGLVPPEVYQQRVRRKKNEEKKKGRKTKEKTMQLLHFNLFITNADAEKLPLDKIMPLYGFRWQVELTFKNWKSLFSIQNMQKMKQARYITMLYTRLILIVVNLQIINRVQSIISKQTNYPDAILSYTKTLNTWKAKFTDILSILRDSLQKAVKILWNLYHILRKNHWREKRNKRENFIENIYLFICTSEI